MVLVEYALEKVDILHLRSRYITRISQGERQRVYIARALVTQAPILLLDEPTANLDIRHQIEIWKLMSQLAKEGKIIVVSTHDISFAKRYCDQLLILNEGQCVSSGPVSAVLTEEIFHNVFKITSLDQL